MSKQFVIGSAQWIEMRFHKLAARMISAMPPDAIERAVENLLRNRGDGVPPRE